jgi:cytochrome oxidase assembly protein ShyY1
MYRFLTRPRWIGFTLLIAALAVLMVNLGFWQLRRLDERRHFNAVVTAHASLPIAPVEQVLTPGTPPADVDWRPITATGTYLADQQVLIVDRSQAGAAGVDVVTPLQLSDGRLLLVDRGFVEGSTPPPAPPSGTVSITGRLRGTETHHYGAIDDPGTGVLKELHRINVPRLAQQLGGETLPMYIDLTTSQPGQGPTITPVPDPQLDEGPHLSYALQWYFFSLCAIGGWVLAVRRSARKRVQAAAAQAAEVEAPTDTDTDTGAATGAPTGEPTRVD